MKQQITVSTDQYNLKTVEGRMAFLTDAYKEALQNGSKWLKMYNKLLQRYQELEAAYKLASSANSNRHYVRSNPNHKTTMIMRKGGKYVK